MNIDELERTSIESKVYDVDVGGEDDTEDTDELATDVCEGDRKIKVLQADEINDVEFCIASSEKILTLPYRLHGNICTRQGCDEMLEFKDTYCGTCLVVTWKCHAGHFGGRWASQPFCPGLRAGNLLLASAIALSGNSYLKVGFLFRIMNMKYISQMLYNQYQSLYIAPTVEDCWKEIKNGLWKDREGKSVILSSDERNDSPGHCALYCTYSFADMETKSILSLNVVDVREIEGRKRSNMERVGFERGLHELLTSKMDLKEVVTDGHLEISALMSKFEYIF